MRYLNEEEVEFLEGETNLIGVSFRDSESSFLDWLHKTREFYFAKPYPLDFPFSYGDWEVWTQFSKKPWSERDKGSTDYS